MGRDLFKGEPRAAGERLACDNGMTNDRHRRRSPSRAIAVLLVPFIGLPPAIMGRDCQADETQLASPLDRFQRVERHMGVAITITVYGPSEAVANRGLDAAFARFHELDAVCSDYRADSELMTVCRAADAEKPVQVSADLLRILVEARRISQLSGGAFDVTIGPVVKLWRRARRRQELPPADELREALAKVGYEQLVLDVDRSTIRFPRPGIRIDLGGIAKGFAADEALEVLRRHGLSRCLIDASGDIRAGAAPPDRAAWRIELPALRPESNGTAEPTIIELVDGAIATSGDLYQFLEVDGVRYSHIVDPRTGLGIVGSSSVTVVAPTATSADAWASALSVLGPAGFGRLKPVPHISARIRRLVDDRVETSDYGPVFFPACGER